MPPVLEVKGIEIAFSDRRVLEGVSLSLQAGEILVLLGPNGAGKSTLIKVVSGRLVPTAGRVAIDGLDPVRDAGARRRIGIVPQGIALFERLSAAENLAAFGRLMGVDRRMVATAVAQALAKVGLSDRAGDRVGSLSGGMRRRINIAAALMHDPKVLILDEPTAGLDYQSQAGLVAMLRGLRASGLGILLTTHDMTEAEALADRVAIMVAGSVRAVGRIDELVSTAFAGRRELSLRLAAAAIERAGPRIAVALSAAGLTRHDDGRTWSGVVDARDESLRTLVATVSAATGLVEDMRIRQPGLDSLLRRHVDAATMAHHGPRFVDAMSARAPDPRAENESGTERAVRQGM